MHRCSIIQRLWDFDDVGGLFRPYEGDKGDRVRVPIPGEAFDDVADERAEGVEGTGANRLAPQNFESRPCSATMSLLE